MNCPTCHQHLEDVPPTCLHGVSTEPGSICVECREEVRRDEKAHSMLPEVRDDVTMFWAKNSGFFL